MNDVAKPGQTNAGQGSRKTVAFVGAGVVLAVVVIAASLVVYRLGKTGEGNNRQERNIRSFLPAKQADSSFPSAVPTPTPLLGPGPFACDPYGFCNAYEDSKRTGCPKTYADRYCLDECQKTNVRCPK
jgi:hypothetical protein